MSTVPTYLHLRVQYVAIVAPRRDDFSKIKAFPCLGLGHVMSGTRYDMLTKFLKMKPLTFIGSKTEDIFKFSIDYLL